jgi:hypothetical protein
VSEYRSRQGISLGYSKQRGRVKDSLLASKDDVAVMFREMIDDVERNHGTQVTVVFLVAESTNLEKTISI